MSHNVVPFSYRNSSGHGHSGQIHYVQCTYTIYIYNLLQQTYTYSDRSSSRPDPSVLGKMQGGAYYANNYTKFKNVFLLVICWSSNCSLRWVHAGKCVGSNEIKAIGACDWPLFKINRPQINQQFLHGEFPLGF